MADQIMRASLTVCAVACAILALSMAGIAAAAALKMLELL